MGYDISFHPISETQIQRWYFDALEDRSIVKSLAKKHKIDTDDNFYEEKYLGMIDIGLKQTTEKSFDDSHGYYIANVQGIFQEFFYIRGAAFSFIENAKMDFYYKKWEEFIPEKYKKFEIHNKIQSNYYSGKFIPYDKVCKLLDDYQDNNEIKDILDTQFSHNRIKVLLKALNFAKELKVGLLEADGVMEPNPLDLNESTCYSNLFNCDIEGPLLFVEAVKEQLAQVEKQQNLAKNEISDNADYKKTTVKNPQKKKSKKGFFKRFFGK